MVNGSLPGPAPAAQARASSSRLTRSNWQTWPHRKLLRKVPSVDGALTAQPSTCSVPPARSASASSMQSPPASADAARVSILSPAESKKRRTPSTSRPAEAEPVPEPKRLALPKTQGIKLTPQQRQEWDRANRAALRQRRKELGICRDCKNLAVPGKTRCPDCAEKHSKRQR